MYLSRGEDCSHILKVVLITQRCFHSLCNGPFFLSAVVLGVSVPLTSVPELEMLLYKLPAKALFYFL